MEQRKNKQDCEQKLHPIQCSATVLRQLGNDFPWTYGAVVAGILVVGLAFYFVPSRRASKVDPIVALRNE